MTDAEWITGYWEPPAEPTPAEPTEADRDAEWITGYWEPPAEPTPAEPTEADRIASRRVVQIAFDSVDAETTALIALCDDGSMWCSATGSRGWIELPAIPQP
jgi:hypothetical protein